MQPAGTYVAEMLHVHQLEFELRKVLLDVTGTGKLVSSSICYNLIEEVCPIGSVYETFRGLCCTLPSANCANSTAITLARGTL